MNCKKCGKALKPDDKFCSGCGTPVEHKEIFFAEVGFNSGNGAHNEGNTVAEDKGNKRKKFQVETFHWDLEGFPKSESSSENKNYGLDDYSDSGNEESTEPKKTESVLFDWSEVVEPKKREASSTDFKWNNDDFPTSKKSKEEESRPARFDWGIGNTTRFDRIPLVPNEGKEIVPSEDDGADEESEVNSYVENISSPFDELSAENSRNEEAEVLKGNMQKNDFIPPIAKSGNSGRPIVVNKFEDLEEEVKGVNETEARKIDKFYTFNQKNEEFQALLDQEYERLRRRLREESEQEARLQERSKALEDARKNWDLEDIRIKREDEVDVQLESTPLSDLDKISMGHFNMQGLNNKKTPLDDIIAVSESLTAGKEAEVEEPDKPINEAEILAEAGEEKNEGTVEDKAVKEDVTGVDNENLKEDEEILNVGEQKDEEDACEQNDEKDQSEEDASEASADDETVEEDSREDADTDIDTEKLQVSEVEEADVAGVAEEDVKGDEKEDEATGKNQKEKVSHGAETMQLERIIVDDLEKPIEPMESSFDHIQDDEAEVQEELSKGASDEANLLFVGKPAEVTVVDETKDPKPNKKLATTATYVGIFTDDEDLANGKKKRADRKKRKEEKKLRDAASSNKPKKRSKAFIWDILILILTCIVILMAIGAFAPDSFIGQKINTQFNKVVNLIKGDDSKAENRLKAEKDMSPTDKAIKNRSSLNKNIAYVVGNPGLKIDVEKDYGMEFLNGSTTFKDSQWYSDEKEKSVSYLEAIVGTLMTYYSDYSNLISKGSEDVYKNIVENSQANEFLNSINGNEKGFKIERLDIGEIRNNGDHYFVITNLKTKSGSGDEKSEMNVIDLIKDGKTLKINGIYSEDR